MNFSEVFKANNGMCKFSPDGDLLANAVQYRLVIRDVKTLQIRNIYTCLDTIQYIEWSCDSEFILCAMYKRGLVQVWSIEQAEWYCKIDEASTGPIDVHWSTDGRHILTTAEFHLRITIWSIIDKKVSYLKHPKNCQKGLDFSKNKQYLALAERRDCKDYISIFDCISWNLIKHFPTDTFDLDGVEWAPNSHVLCVWESCLEYKILIYSLDGRNLSSFSPYEHGLGIKTISWSPSSQFLAIGSYDEKIRIINNLTWKVMVSLDHPGTVAIKKSTVCYKEVIAKTTSLNGHITNSASKYEIMKGALQIPVVIPDPNKPNPKKGIGILKFSYDGQYFCSRNDNMPCALWIWDIHSLSSVAVLMQDKCIKGIEWDPCENRLALVTGNNKVYLWSPAGCLSVSIPNESSFQVNKVVWHPRGNVLLVYGCDQMCVCFLSTDNKENLS